MKRTRSSHGAPAEVRAAEILLAVCRMGLQNPDPSMVVAFATFAAYLQGQIDAARPDHRKSARRDSCLALTPAGGGR